MSDKSIESVKTEVDLTTVVLGNKSVFGDSKITLMFDPKSYKLQIPVKSCKNCEYGSFVSLLAFVAFLETQLRILLYAITLKEKFR